MSEEPDILTVNGDELAGYKDSARTGDGRDAFGAPLPDWNVGDTYFDRDGAIALRDWLTKTIAKSEGE